MSEEERECEVCGKKGLLVVLCSALGAFSLGYCAECAESGREPYGLLVGCLYFADSLEDISTHLHEVVDASLKFAGKSRAEFFADTAETQKKLEGGL